MFLLKSLLGNILLLAAFLAALQKQKDNEKIVEKNALPVSAEKSLLPDTNPLIRAYAKNPDVSACENCCPRPKATRTVTETGHITVTCTHSFSSDRIQSTTVRFTSTEELLRTITQTVNFVDTTTVISSTQVTTFETTEQARYRIFTKTETVFTDFAIATIIRTTRSLSTRTVSTLVFTTTTSTIFATVSSQSIFTTTSTSTLNVPVVSLVITTQGAGAVTSTVTSTFIELTDLLLPDQSVTFTESFTITTSTLLESSFVLGTATVDNRNPTAVINVTVTNTLTGTVILNTNNFVDFTSAVSTRVYSKLYPIEIIP